MICCIGAGKLLYAKRGWLLSGDGAEYFSVSMKPVGKGPTVLAVCAGGGCLLFFSLAYQSYIVSLSFLPLSGRRLDIYCNTVSKSR